MKLDNNMQIIDLSEILDENFGDKVDVRKFQSRLLSDVDATIKTDACYLCAPNVQVIVNRILSLLSP